MVQTGDSITNISIKQIKIFTYIINIIVSLQIRKFAHISLNEITNYVLNSIQLLKKRLIILANLTPCKTL